MTDTVRLDVSGTIFKTAKSTLTKFDGFFRTMFETPVPVPKDESDAIFIDRSPKHFDLILNSMRDGHVDLQKYLEDVKEIQKEAEYYMLNGLVELCYRIPSENKEPVEIKELKDDRDEMNAILGLEKKAFVIIYLRENGEVRHRHEVLDIISKYGQFVDFYTAPHRRGPGWSHTAFKVFKKSRPLGSANLKICELDSVIGNFITS